MTVPLSSSFSPLPADRELLPRATRVTVHLCRKLIRIVRELETLKDETDEAVVVALRINHDAMETLGNFLSNRDAFDESDDWTCEIFKVMQQRFGA